ncbi:uncharacterized protein [Procambarus clarkii]|uniref:uncharacterized protein n=1 Tax=Procambarus clarkii TaxID=6728 RepID=UPI003743ABF8
MAEKATIDDLDDVQAFLNREDCLARLKYLSKPELVLVSAYLEIKIRASDSRVEILSKVHRHLKAEEKQEGGTPSTREGEEIASTEKEDKGSDVDSDAGELNISFLTVKMRALEINREIEWKKLEMERERQDKELEMRRLELEERKAEREREEKREREREEREREEKREREEREREEKREREEREREEKQREREEKERQRQHELEVLRLGGGRRPTTETSSFDPVRNIKMVPKFNEREVSKFFAAFEKVAASLEWPRENWAIMIQSVLTGKAQIAYSTLSLDDSGDYDKVKKVVLMAYQLVPEAYRQKFRNLKKTSEHTFTEFATIKERLFQEWCASRKVETKEDLEQLILLEDFKDCLSGDLKTYLEEQQVETLSAAATMAEEYILTHRPSAKYVPRYYQRRFDKPHEEEETPVPRSAKKTPPSSPRRTSPSSPKHRSPRRNMVCWTCGQKGHIAARCRGRRGGGARREVMLMSCGTSPAGNQSTTTQEGPRLFSPHTSGGYVSSDHTGRSVVVLRDSGAAQSLIVKNSLPEGVSVDGRQQVVLVGFPRTQYIAPLVTVHLDSPYFSGTCALAVVDTLPVAGIDVVLANDLVTDWSTNLPKVADESTGTARSEVTTGNGNVQVKTDPDVNMFNLSSHPQIDCILAESPDFLDKEHEVTMAEVPEQEERPCGQAPTDTEESGVKAPVYLQPGKVQCMLNRPEIPQTSEVCEVCAKVLVPSLVQTRLMEVAGYGHNRLRKLIPQVTKCFLAVFCVILVCGLSKEQWTTRRMMAPLNIGKRSHGLEICTASVAVEEGTWKVMVDTGGTTYDNMSDCFRQVDTPRVIAEPQCSVIRNVGRPDGGRANVIFSVQAALLKLGVSLVEVYAVSIDLPTVAITRNYQTPVFQVPVSLKDYRNGTRNAVCNQPSSVPRHREVSSRPRSCLHRSLLERWEIMLRINISVETWKITPGRTLPYICKFPLCQGFSSVGQFCGRDSLAVPVHNAQPQTKFFLVGRCYEPGSEVRARSSDDRAICGSAPETPSKRTTTPGEDAVYQLRGLVSSLVQHSTQPLLTSGEVVLRHQRHLWSG